uniref:ATP synthase complex subunit 8 n=1 Tax=Crioceris asparagi TaxID=131627 RepID=A0A1P8NN76_CRIAP|nr:ATP synthase F0 subunit 8 [Crioceris asparagi]
MPQMAPLNWVSLFVYFILIFLIFNVSIYFIHLYQPNKMDTKVYTKKINWKW